MSPCATAFRPRPCTPTPTTPVGTTVNGRRQPRDSSQPTPVPARNGHAVSAMPATVSPSAWLRRPIVQNTITQTTSATSAIATGRVRRHYPVGIGHHIENQWADIGFVAGGEAGLHRRGLARFSSASSASCEAIRESSLNDENTNGRPLDAQRIRRAHHVEMQVWPIGIAGVAERRRSPARWSARSPGLTLTLPVLRWA